MSDRPLEAGGGSRAPALKADQELYFDWNATTPPHPDVLSAMAKASAVAWANPASVHRAGRRARQIQEDTRELLAGQLALEKRDLLFTSGGTEANNLALAGAPALVTSRLEHPSVTRVAEQAELDGKPVRWLPVGSDGRVEPDAVAEALRELPRGAVVTLMAVNHETGVQQPLAPVAERVRAAGAWLHVDAVQAVGKLGLDWTVADSVSVAAHKLRGPKGVGALGWRRRQPPRPVLRGGAQERGLRPGTQDASLLAGFGVALARGVQGPKRYQRLESLRDELERSLAPWVEVNGLGSPRVPHVSNFAVAGWIGDELVAALDLAKICISSGSACSAGTTEASPVVSLMYDRDRASRSVRISLGEDHGVDEVRRLIEVLRGLIDPNH